MRRLAWRIGIGVMLLGGAGVAATLDQWRNADGKKGCESIPDSDLQSSCNSYSREVNDFCKSRKISCDDLDPRGLTQQIENLERKIADLERELGALADKIKDTKDDRELRDLEDKHKALEREIKDKKDRVSSWKNTLQDEKRMIDERIYNGEKCVDARTNVAKVFESAKRRAKSENDPDIEPYAKRAIAYWESEERDHADTIRRYEEAVRKCKNMR